MADNRHFINYGQRENDFRVATRSYGLGRIGSSTNENLDLPLPGFDSLLTGFLIEIESSVTAPSRGTMHSLPMRR